MSGLLTIPQAAAILAMSPRTVRRLIEIGKVETVRPGGLRLVRISRAEVERLIAEGTQPVARFWRERKRAS